MAETKILIVEDEGIEVLDLQLRLTSMGYTVQDIVATGEEAVGKAEDTHLDLILMDIMLQGEIDGVEAAARIHSQFDIPVIFLTAYADDKTLERAKVTEPYGYLVKPFQERDLQIAIEMALYKHRMERDLKKSERLLATTLRSIGDGVITTDNNGLINFMNPVAEGLVGWKLNEAVNKKLPDIFNLIDRKSRQAVKNTVSKVLLHGKIVNLANHTMLIAKGGAEIPIDVRAAPIRDDRDNITGVVLVLRDVTTRERAEKEEKRLVAELARSNRELEQFAYIASHDLQSPLRLISGFLNLLSRRYMGKLDAKADEFISSAMRNAERMDQLINDILAFSKEGNNDKPFELLKSQDLLELALYNLQAEIKDSRANLTFDNLPLVTGDRNQLVQVFQNLVGNAIKYHKPHEPPWIQITVEEKPDAWEFRVADNGIGINPQFAERIFQIFQRLHTMREYPGTGIGLATCKKIVERHGGRIWVESMPEQGSTFCFTLPSRQM